MDAKDLRTESTLSERSNDGKYGPSGTSIQCTKTKTYQDIGSSSSNKVDSPITRPCAVIGPDRVIPPPPTEAYLKKASVEHWPFNNVYRRPPEYPNKLPEYQSQIRNISPRQTYQENMQRIMVPPTYSSVKVNEDFNQILDRNNALPSKHSIKLNVVPDNKYCEVPYTNNTVVDQKSVKNAEVSVSNVNPQYPQPVSQAWTPGCVSARPSRGYGATDLYQYPEYSSCAGSRPVPISRPHRTAHEDPSYVYSDPYCQNGNIRFRPYPNVKDRYPQSRYEFVGNYSNPFYPSPVPPHKYDIHKSVATHSYPTYTHLKGLESRMSEPIIEGYHRALPPGSYNIPFRNPVIHPPYGSIIGCPQGKMPTPYLPEGAPKIPVSNKPHYDANSNVYIDYENSRLKGFPMPENLFTNEMRLHSINNQMVMPNYPAINVHSIPPHSYCKRDSLPIKNYEFANNLRNMDPLLNVMNPMSHHLPHFSPGVIPISPTNSNGSTDTHHTHNALHEDCGYVSQSSGGSIKSIDSAIYRNNELHRRYYDPRYRPILRTPQVSKQENQSSLGYKDKKQIDVRQFLQMWNEGDDESGENNTSKEALANPTSDNHHMSRPYDSADKHEQLYVLGLVNVSSEDLSKYEHLQTVSKLPENIKGYNSIELLNQFEEVIESTNMNYYYGNNSKENKMAVKPNVTRQTPVALSRPLSPLDVEAKISQSVIHKEVGCNFEIRPCSPKMLNAELATPVQNILNERVIEKITNPLSTLNSKSPIMKLDENVDTCHIIKNQHHVLLGDHIKSPSCKLANAQYPDSVECLKTNYSFQDFESNSGICLASLPRLDNDIELNFPEVNQQFINANKTESVNKQSAVNEPPHPEITTGNQVQDSKNNECLVPNFTDEHERQFPKLSKFRKNKNSSLEINSDGVQPTIIRTDSVIIKNPENIKNLEVNAEHFPVTTLIKDNQLSAINLTSQCDKVKVTQEDVTQSNLDIEENYDIKDKNSSCELAIDFSFNKNNDDNYMHMDQTSKDDDIATEKIIPPPKYNYEEYGIDKNRNKGLSSDYLEKEECTSSTFVNETVNHLKVVEDKVDTNNSFNMSQNDHSNISEENRAEIIQNTEPNFEVVTEKQKSITSQSNIIKTDFEYSILETFITTKEKRDYRALDKVSDVLSPMPDHPNLKEINNKSIKENHTDIEDNGTNVINFVQDCVDTNESIDRSETNEDSVSLIPILKTSEKTFESNLPYVSKANNSNSSCSKDSEAVIPEITDTEMFQQKPFLEGKEIKSEVEHEKCDEVKGNSLESADYVDTGIDMISKLVETNTEEDHVNIKNANEDVISQPTLEIYAINSEQNVQLKGIMTEVKVKQCNSLTTINSALFSTLQSDPDIVIEPQQIRKKIQRHQSVDAEVNLGQVEVPDDSSINILDPNGFYQDVKSSEQEIVTRNQGDQFTVNSNPFNEIDITKVSNAVNLQKEEINEDDDNKCPENVITGCRAIENNLNFSDNILYLNNMDNKEEHLEKDMLIEKTPMNSKKHLVQNDLNHIIEFPNLNNNFSDVDRLDKEIISQFDNAMKDKTESLQKSNRTKNDLGKPLENLLAHKKTVAKNESKGSMEENSHINEQLFNRKKSDEGTIHKLDKQSDANSKEGIYQRIMNHSETFKLIVSDENIMAINSNYNFRREVFFRKSLYSPYIQKLLTFYEGNCNSYNKMSTSSDYGENLQKDTIVAHCGNRYITSNNIESKDKHLNHCTGRNLIKNYVSKSSRLVDYDSSDCSLSPCAALEFKSQSKLEENFSSEKNLQESLEIKDLELEVQINQKILPTSTELYLKKANTNESTGKNQNSEIVLDTEHKKSSKIELKDDIGKLNDIKYNNLLDLVEDTQGQNIDENLTGTDVENSIICQLEETPRHSLKRSLSDSALYNLSEDFIDKSTDNIPYTWSFKRKKVIDNFTKPSIATENFSNVINSNRRNSISSTYTEENVAFCILIDNDCIITEEDNDSKLCYTEISESLIADIPNSSLLNTDSVMEIISAENQQDSVCEYSDSYVLECNQGKSPEAQWVDEVACVETVVSDDIAEDIVISATSPNYVSDCDEPEVFFPHTNEHTDIVKHIYGDKLCQNDAEFVETLYKTPQMDVNKTLIHRESQESESCDRYYDRESLERVLSEENSQCGSPYSPTYHNQIVFGPISPHNNSSQNYQKHESVIHNHQNEKNGEVDNNVEKRDQQTQDDTVHSCESSIDNVFSYSMPNESIDRLTSSSPEVSSTTSEEKGSSILLKITNFKGSIVSQISEYSSEIISENVCIADKNNALDSNNKLYSKKPLITKGAQKYIPPLKETIRDFKVQISLPQDSLNKFKQMKISKEELKQYAHNPVTPNIPKKPKPKFEDVLKSIDEIQFKMHKEKNKKLKKSIPKVVIKKSLNGSHYASTKNKTDTFNPDLTGRKWQPWVFLEKKSFIDKMAIRKKTKAIFSHRKNTYVLAEKFYKYKSVNSATFVITQPTYSKPSSGGQLKYTIRLKHSY